MILKEARRVLNHEGRAIIELCKTIDGKFVDTVQAILNIKGRLVVVGVGKSGLVGRKIASTLSSTGTPALFLHPTDALHGDIGVLTKNDMVLAISFSGETREV